MLLCTQSNNGYLQTITLLLLGCFFIFTITQILRFRRKQKKTTYYLRTKNETHAWHVTSVCVTTSA